MNPDLWAEVERLYHAALEHQAQERTAFLDRACSNAEIRREVESLLQHEQEGDRFEDPPWKPQLGPALAAGSRLGPYEILESIGAGGMGEVYRARDTKLGRDVALKVLPELYAHDGDRMARFGREARLLASLNHPNIAAIYGLEESQGIRALVMELVPGATLAERIGGRALAREEALPIAKQIVEALEYAHEKGIIHRDLKPANVKLTAEVNVKVLDFGLAKALEGPASAAQDPLAAPTLTDDGTRPGIIMGTPAYMSPEQAQGKPVDRRADIWSFGVVLYEMLTGKQLYSGESSAEIMASVIKDAPNLDGLPSGLRYIVERCLRKDPRQRWQSIGDVRIALDEGEVHAQSAPRGTRRFNLTLFALAAASVAGFLLLGYWLMRRQGPVKLLLPVPITSSIGFASAPSFSPDGKQIAYCWQGVNDSTSSVYVKLVGTDTELRVTQSPGTDMSPAFSPDGRFIAFYRDAPGHSGYYVVSALGGPVRQILRTARWSALQFGPSDDWLLDGKHVVAGLPSGIVSVDVDTGEQKQLTNVNGNVLDLQVVVSPDGKFLAFYRLQAVQSGDIYVIDLDRGAERRLTNLNTDLGGIAWTADSREIVFTMDLQGTSQLWRIPERGGAVHQATSSMEGLCCPTIARQGNRLAYIVSHGLIGLWRTDISGTTALSAGTPTKLISSIRGDISPMYSRNGQKLAFSSARSGPREIWEADADGKNLVQLTHVGGPDNGTSRWSPDGSQVAFDSRAYADPEILVVTDEGRNIRRITNNPAEDVTPSWSADGQWIYFASNRNGDFQIFKVRSDLGESPASLALQVTKAGGLNGVESADGKFLYFAKGRGKPGLWRCRVNAPLGETEEPVLESLHNWGWWALAPNGIFFLEATGAPSKVHLKFFDLNSKRITDLRVLQHDINPLDAPITVSPDGRHVVYEQQENLYSSVVMIENFR